MSELKEKLIPNEVVLVGRLRDEKGDNTIDVTLTGKELAQKILSIWKFQRETAPSKEAQDAGFATGKFFHIQVADPGGETIKLPNGKTMTRSRKTTTPGFDVVFESNRGVVYNEIKEQLITYKFEPVGGDANCGKVRLTEYALIGFWDEFPTGFDYNPHFFDPKNNGKLMPLMSSPKQDDGTYKKEKAIANTGRHFVYEDEIDNIELLRSNIRKRVERWKVTIVPNTDNRGVLDSGESKVKVEAPVTKTPPINDDV